jgi:glycosyltransferase involved in cell wall biosynthesis
MRAFSESLGIASSRLIFAPNKFPSAPAAAPAPLRAGTQTVVGMFGTDSPKKNYGELFAALAAGPRASRIRFRLYGHRTAYYENLVAQFPYIDTELVESDTCAPAEFFANVDLIVSVADHEGFGRPIAAALLAGVPALMMARPVFLEFFEHGASFAPDIAGVVAAMAAFDPAAPRPAPVYRAPDHAVAGFISAVDFMRARAGGIR